MHLCTVIYFTHLPLLDIDIISNDIIVLWAAQTTPGFRDLLGRTHGTQCVAILTAKVYYSERVPTKMKKGKRHLR